MPSHNHSYSNNSAMTHQLSQAVVHEMRHNQIPEFRPSDFLLPPGNRPLSDGGCGDVYKWQLRPTGQKVAVKVIKKAIEQHASSERLAKIRFYFEREYNIWGRLDRRHPNIVPLLGFIAGVEDRIFPGLVTPWYQNGDLWTYLERYGSRVRLVEKLGYLYSVANALEFLHAHRIAHRDIKAANVLLDDNKIAKLADYGASKWIDQQFVNSSSNPAINHWMPPEYVRDIDRVHGDFHDPKPNGDIWSFGCLLFEVVRIRVPYGHEDPIRYLSEGRHPPPPPAKERFDSGLWSFLTRECWLAEPTRRRNARRIKEVMNQFIADAKRRDQERHM